MNTQPTKELYLFQKVILQDKYIKYLNKACDHWEWEFEKQQTIVEMREAEITDLKKSIHVIQTDRDNTVKQFKEYRSRQKEVKRDDEKIDKQQKIIDQLRGEKAALESQVKTRDSMLALMQRQARKKE